MIFLWFIGVPIVLYLLFLTLINFCVILERIGLESSLSLIASIFLSVIFGLLIFQSFTVTDGPWGKLIITWLVLMILGRTLAKDDLKKQKEQREKEQRAKVREREYTEWQAEWQENWQEAWKEQFEREKTIEGSTIEKAHSVLGTNKDMTKMTVRRIYRELAFQNHPDRNKSTDALARMQEINAAKDILIAADHM
jgi:DnaJ domain